MEETLWETGAAAETTREYRDIWNAYDAEHGAVRASISHSDEDLAKFAGKNILRVMREVES